jgi:hypothetical protein
MIYIALKDFEKAHDCFKMVTISNRHFSLFSQVMTAPGSACSAIQVEAYKKFVLLCLILYGKVAR